MTNESFLKIEPIGECIPREKSFWWSVGAMIGIAGGLTNIVIAIVLTMIMWIFSDDPDHDSLRMVANFIFYSVFPLLFLGAHCLDKIDEFQKTKSRENRNEYHK